MLFRAWTLVAVSLCAAQALCAAGVAIAADPPVAAAKQKTDGTLRRLEGKYITLVTDLPAAPEVDSLVAAFDQAVPQWCKYFGLPPDAAEDWHATASVMVDPKRFVAAGLLPADLPPFAHGYYVGTNLWVHEQPSDYYRRHLLLHEGAHSFMDAMFRGHGPPWYAEGMAELLATHAWRDGRVQIAYFPPSSDEVPLWGRVKLVRDAMAAGRHLDLKAILSYGDRAHIENEPYGWCWAAAAFLDGHPRYRERFRALAPNVAGPDFNAQFVEQFRGDWRAMNEEWDAFIDELVYGYDLERAAIEFAPGQPVGAAGREVTVAADRGWQSSGIRLEAGKQYDIEAQGRYQVAQDPRIWWCEPGGVTLRYVRGRPLGLLLAVIRPDEPDPTAPTAFLKPLAVGLATSIRPETTGTLYFKINDSPSELADNAGSLRVSVKPQ